jgi:hypothetical protein
MDLGFWAATRKLCGIRPENWNITSEYGVISEAIRRSISHVGWLA